MLQTIEPADLVPHRPRADVLVNGFSFGYGGQDDNRRVGLQVRRGAETLIDKRLIVRASDTQPLSLGVGPVFVER